MSLGKAGSRRGQRKSAESETDFPAREPEAASDTIRRLRRRGFSAFSAVFVRADFVFRGRNRIVGQALIVDPGAVRVALLFVTRAIAFDRAFVNIVVLLHLGRHRCHGAAPIC